MCQAGFGSYAVLLYGFKHIALNRLNVKNRKDMWMCCILKKKNLFILGCTIQFLSPEDSFLEDLFH